MPLLSPGIGFLILGLFIGIFAQDLDQFAALIFCTSGTVNDVCTVDDSNLPPLPDSVVIRGSGSLVIESSTTVDCIPIPEGPSETLEGICHVTFDFAGNVTIRGVVQGPFVNIRAKNLFLEGSGRIDTTGRGWGTTFDLVGGGLAPSGVADEGVAGGEGWPCADVLSCLASLPGQCSGGGGGGHAGAGGDGCGAGIEWLGGSGIPPEIYDDPSWPLARGSRGGRGLEDNVGVGTLVCLGGYQPTVLASCEPGKGGGSVRIEVINEVSIPAGTAIRSDGTAGEECDAAGAGGGGGGAIAIDANVISGSGVLSAVGGAGADADLGVGGGGGGGIVTLLRPDGGETFSGSISIAGGAGQTANVGFPGCSSGSGSAGVVTRGPRRLVKLSAGGTTVELRFSPTFSIYPTADNSTKCHVTPRKIVESGGITPMETWSSQPIFRLALDLSGLAGAVYFLGDMANNAQIYARGTLYDSDDTVTFGSHGVNLNSGDFKTDISIEQWAWSVVDPLRKLTLHYVVDCDNGVDNLEIIQGTDAIVAVIDPTGVGPSDWQLAIELLSIVGVDSTFPQTTVTVAEFEEDGRTKVEFTVVIPRFTENGQWDPTFDVLLDGESPDVPGGDGQDGGDGGGNDGNDKTTAAVAVGTIVPLSVIAVCCCGFLVCASIIIAFIVMSVASGVAAHKRKMIFSQNAAMMNLTESHVEPL